MPLLAGKKNIGKNIAELESSKTKAGKKRSRKQNIAIALEAARKSGAKIPRRGTKKKNTKPKTIKRNMRK